MVTLGPLLRLRRKKEQRMMRFNQRMTLRKFQLDQEGDHLETKIPTLSSTNGHWHSAQTRKPITTLLSMTASAENVVNLSVLQANVHVCSLFLAFECKVNYGTYKPNENYFFTLTWKLPGSSSSTSYQSHTWLNSSAMVAFRQTCLHNQSFTISVIMFLKV